MRTYTLDIDPSQVVRWLIAESDDAQARFQIQARRGTEVHQIPARKEFHLGDEEREDLSEVDTLATLQIAPANANEGWTLTVEIEDEAGPRLLEDESSIESDEPMDIRTFYDDFLRPGRGIANVVAKVADDAAESRLRGLVNSIENDRHAPKS
jgi:hypothetical protein